MLHYCLPFTTTTNPLEEGAQYALKCLNLPRISGTAPLTNTLNDAVDDDHCSLSVQGTSLSILENEHFEADYWKGVQDRLRRGEIIDVFPYREELRFRK